MAHKSDTKEIASGRKRDGHLSTNPSASTVICAHTAISRKVVGKNVHATVSKGNMGYDQNTVPDDCSCRTYICCFPLALENTFPWPFVPILSNFFEERRTQNHPQCLLGLSRALFPTTFLKNGCKQNVHMYHYIADGVIRHLYVSKEDTQC